VRTGPGRCRTLRRWGLDGALRRDTRERRLPECGLSPGDVVVIGAETDRGIRADADRRMEALLVTAPPPTDAEHEPVRERLRQNEFDPHDS
jgi:quercetin dioxygenase-like cupin family protein